MRNHGPVDFKSPEHAIVIRVARTMLPIIASLQLEATDLVFGYRRLPGAGG